MKLISNSAGKNGSLNACGENVKAAKFEKLNIWKVIEIKTTYFLLNHGDGI